MLYRTDLQIWSESKSKSKLTKPCTQKFSELLRNASNFWDAVTMHRSNLQADGGEILIELIVHPVLGRLKVKRSAVRLRYSKNAEAFITTRPGSVETLNSSSRRKRNSTRKPGRARSDDAQLRHCCTVQTWKTKLLMLIAQFSLNEGTSQNGFQDDPNPQAAIELYNSQTPSLVWDRAAVSDEFSQNAQILQTWSSKLKNNQIWEKNSVYEQLEINGITKTNQWIYDHSIGYEKVRKSQNFRHC